MEIAVSRSMSHMLWNIGADRGQLLLLCRIRNEMKSLIWTVCTFTSNIPSMLVEGGIDRKKHFKQPLPLLWRVQRPVEETRQQVFGLPTWASNPRLPFKGRLPPLLNVLCVWCVFQDDKRTLRRSPSWHNVYLQNTACFMSNLYVNYSILISKRISSSLARIKMHFQAKKTISLKTAAALKMFFFFLYKSKPSREDMNF